MMNPVWVSTNWNGMAHCLMRERWIAALCGIESRRWSTDTAQDKPRCGVCKERLEKEWKSGRRKSS